MVVGACAGSIAEAAQEFGNGGLTPATKGRGGNLFWELFKLRQFMLADFPDFDNLAKARGLEAMAACNAPAATASWLVDEAMNILAKIVRDQLN